MNYYEGITTAIAVVALIVSAVAMYRAGVANKLAKDANDLARSQDDLAKLHLQAEYDKRNKTYLTLEMVEFRSMGGTGRPTTNYRVRLTNVGAGSATDAGFKIRGIDSPVDEGELAEKLPSTLTPGQNVDVFAAINMDSPSKFDAVVYWTNPDGSKERQDRVLTW